MSKKKFEEFVIKLSEDPKLNESYVENPEAVMKDFGLEEREIKAIMKGDQKEIKNILGDPQNCLVIIVMCKDKKK
ncbi:hypothetical protein [Kangiella taiwanensis]|uniref:Extradiol ring-cleavage dioxygenase LigAB LigA subunit domain-containing protein n=1 Tax=Kangiella taiwanensis TaxID=1079179 RepID=A0ABP8HVY9_9GAMM|nr:hypothetical protein [Kangiella taiwanensis]